MGAFSRLKTIFSGKVNKKLDEMENPIEGIDLEIRRQKENIANAKKGSATAIGSLKIEKDKLSKMKEDLFALQSALERAGKDGNVNVVKELMTKKIELDNKIANQENKIKSLQSTADNFLKQIKDIENQIKAQEDERDQLAGEWEIALAKKDMNESLANINVDGTSFSKSREKIEKMKSYAEGLETMKEVSNSNMSNEAQSYLNNTNTSNVDAEVEEFMKKFNNQ